MSELSPTDLPSPVAAQGGEASRLAPVDSAERIHALDLLRGWAMFGVLWSNLNSSYGTRPPSTALDHGLRWVQQTLVQDRFYTLLTLLFGVGFGIQLLRAGDRGVDLRNTYYRRSAALLAIGVVHGTLIWFGDILTIYALVAFALVMFRTLSTRRILVISILLWIFGDALVRYLRIVAGFPFMNPGGPTDAFLGTGTWMQIQPVRVGLYMNWLASWGLTSYPAILAAFLLGLWTMKSGYLRRVTEDSKSTRRLLVVAAVAIAVAYLGYAYADRLWPPVQPPPGLVETFPYPYRLLANLRRSVFNFYDLEVLGESLGYAAVILLLWQRGWGMAVLRPLAATGRMALTTYLTQSVVCTLLFFGYGLGLYGQVGHTGMLALTLILFACQMAVSTWWLKRYRFGPVEWLWRRMTYGSIGSMHATGRLQPSRGAAAP